MSIARILFPQESTIVAGLRQELAVIRSELEIEKLRNELLAALNEHLRQMILANTAVAIKMQKVMGVPGK